MLIRTGVSNLINYPIWLAQFGPFRLSQLPLACVRVSLAVDPICFLRRYSTLAGFRKYIHRHRAVVSSHRRLLGIIVRESSIVGRTGRVHGRESREKRLNLLGKSQWAIRIEKISAKCGAVEIGRKIFIAISTPRSLECIGPLLQVAILNCCTKRICVALRFILCGASAQY